MQVVFSKYHALQNDFLIINQTNPKMSKARLSRLARSICNRHYGVGADGILYLSESKKGDRRIDIFNADGSWAEKSGNGLRIAGVHEFLRDKKKRTFVFEAAGTLDKVKVLKFTQQGYVVESNLGEPEFRAELIPVTTEQRYMINAPLAVGGVKFPVTCVAVGNPHAVLFVDDFEFDWKALGAEIEVHRAFPNRTNVEFAKVISRKKIKVAGWERGAGSTGSSGTGAAAAVCAAIMLGLVDRSCEVVFETGSLLVRWLEANNSIELIGPVKFIATGTFEFK